MTQMERKQGIFSFRCGRKNLRESLLGKPTQSGRDLKPNPCTCTCQMHIWHDVNRGWETKKDTTTPTQQLNHRGIFKFFVFLFYFMFFLLDLIIIDHFSLSRLSLWGIRKIRHIPRQNGIFSRQSGTPSLLSYIMPFRQAGNYTLF